jgi:hypothetical protein
VARLQLSDTVEVQLDVAPQAANANVNGAIVDMQGWDGCLFVYQLGAMAAGSTFTAYAQTSANVNMAGAANVPNAALPAVPNTSNTNVALLDVWGPANRYLQAVAVPAGGNVTFGSVAVRYRRQGLLLPTQAAVAVVKASST